ncbi:MAG: FixH family protein [Methylobacillus sp.]|jgi:nitrogen fixation protein FixH|nr:FixH family protein [Methylobacillus sp.]
MTMTETLFGGMIAVVLIFLIARRFRLSSYWSATLAGLLPFGGYIAFIFNDSFGGDVLAIHFVVFIMTAAVLAVFSIASGRKEKMHWAPKLIIAFFIVLALLNAAFLSVAKYGMPDWLAKLTFPDAGETTVHTAFPGSVPHDNNKLYGDHQAQVEAQRKLNWQVDLQGLRGIKAGARQALTLTVRDAQGQPVVADNVMLGFWRMANSRDDRMMQLQAAEPGVYKTDVQLDDEGKWLVELHIARGQDTYHTKQALLVAEPDKN